MADQTIPSTAPCHWFVGQIVEVLPRTWAGINRPGGHGKITKIHLQDGNVEGLDVKYTISNGADKCLDPDLVKPYKDLERSRRTLLTEPGAGKENQKKKQNLVRSTKREIKSKTESTPSMEQQMESLKMSETHADVCNVKGSVPSVPQDTPSKPEGIPSEILVGEVEPCLSPLHDVHSAIKCLPAKSHREETEINPAKRPKSNKKGQEKTHVSAVNVSLSSNGGVGGCKPVEVHNCTSVKEMNSGPVRLQQQRLSLRDVYDQERQAASNFIDDVLRNPETAPSAGNQTLATLCTGTPSTENREYEFRSMLNYLLQTNGGMLEERGLHSKMNNLSAEKNEKGSEFTVDEVTSFLIALCNENKVFRHDGIILEV